MSHQGRPKGKRNEEYSQKPIVSVLEKFLKRPVQFADDCTGEKTEAAAQALKPGEVLFLENLRYEAGEEANDAAFAQKLANLADIYVNDAFTNCHRAHASMVGVPKLLPSYVGLQLAKELEYLSKIIDDPKRPLTLIVSGAKMETKVPIIEHFLQKGDDVLLGGCIANTFIAAEGQNVGASRFEKEFAEKATMIMEAGKQEGTAKIHVPVDVVVASDPADTQKANVESNDIPADKAIFDIGIKTLDEYCRVISASKSIVWNGPIGMYEMEHFAEGSKRIAQAIADATKKGAITIIGGGDTIDLHVRYGLPLDTYTFVSTGGGAMLEFIGGKKLPAIAALEVS